MFLHSRPRMSRLLLARAGASYSLSYTSFLTGDGVVEAGSFDTRVRLSLGLTPRIVDGLLLRGAYACRGSPNAPLLDAAGHDMRGGACMRQVVILSLSPSYLSRLARRGWEADGCPGVLVTPHLL
ncbi:hypothetical protein B0H14DRAFT_2743628 [Mycena olivaceomarginata]|nr:hypothetical protein B0H14DRAFT_2743628 [Mycena olivaceomarginata]